MSHKVNVCWPYSFCLLTAGRISLKSSLILEFRRNTWSHLVLSKTEVQIGSCCWYQSEIQMQSWHCLILPLDEDNEGVIFASNRCLICCTDQSIYRSTYLPFELVWSLKVPRCCADGERLETSDPTFPRCVPHPAGHLNKLTLQKEIIGLDITKDLESREVDITLSYVPGCPRMPQCKGRKVSAFWRKTLG